MSSLSLDTAFQPALRLDRVQDGRDRGEKRLMVRFGAFVRRRARSSMRRRKRPSRPGEPPSAHSGELKLIFFHYDPKAHNVVIGPLLFRRRGSKTGAELLEFGGSVPAQDGVGLDTYLSRPFMGPAFETELDKVPELLTNQVY